MWAHEAWTFYLFGSLFGLGFGGEMTAYLVVNRQYFGTGPTSTVWLRDDGRPARARRGERAGRVVLYATGSFWLVLLLSMAFSLVGVGVILRLESSAQVLIPHWEESLPLAARSMTMRPSRS